MTDIGAEIYTRITRRTKTDALTYTEHVDVTDEWEAMRAVVEASLEYQDAGRVPSRAGRAWNQAVDAYREKVRTQPG